MVQINIDDLEKIKEIHKDKTIVFCSGVFDLTHVGHIFFIENCKKRGDILVVAVGNDEVIKSYKGEGRPILNEKVRIKAVDSLEYVDYSFLYPPMEEDKSNILSPLIYIMKKLKPNLWIINNDALYIPERNKIASELGIKLVILDEYYSEKFGRISTSGIIKKIKDLT